MNVQPNKDGLNLIGIPVLPKITESLPLDRISFSNYIKMKACPLKGLPDRCIKFTEKPPLFLKSKAQLFGIFLHAMLERVPELRNCDLRDRPNLLKKDFFEQLSKFEKQYSNYSWLLGNKLFSKLPEAGVIYGQISRIIFDKSSFKAKNNSEMRVTPEKVLRSKDGLLFGKADALLASDAERIIVEHKAGEIFDGKYLKNEIYQQVHFYAELTYEEYGAYPTYLIVRGPNQKIWRNPPDIKTSKQLGAAAREVLNHYNSKVNNNKALNNIAQVSNETCAGCQYQAFCPPYWAKCGTVELSENFQSLKIKEIGIIKGASSNKNALKAKVIDGKLKGKDIVINEFYPKRFSNYEQKPSRELMITNLIVDDLKCSGRFTETSQFYKITSDK